jgi:hypothetical protein
MEGIVARRPYHVHEIVTIACSFGHQRDNTPEHLSASSPRPQNTNDLQAWEGPGDKRHPSSLRRQLHRGSAASALAGDPRSMQFSVRLEF